MKIQLTDNEALFLEAVVGAIKHADSSANISHKRNLDSVNLTIKPSSEEFKQDIITNLVNLHRLYHLKVTFSKSLERSSSITFSINLENYT